MTEVFWETSPVSVAHFMVAEIWIWVVVISEGTSPKASEMQFPIG